jgi:hypothetical protein
MPAFGKASQERLATCHPDLVRLFNEVVKIYDCTVTCGHRGKEAQDEAVRIGTSKAAWPNGPHNSSPSRAVDVLPYPFDPRDWEDLRRFYQFSGVVLATAARLGIKIRWGGDWNGDLQFRDNKWNDLPHYELLGA